MRTRLPLLVLLLAVSFLSASAQHFSSFFRDSTLRLDYILSGNSEKTEITPDEHHLLSGWAGRRYHLDSLALRGNAQLYVHDEASGKLIYAFSFNPLYLEWRQTPLSKTERRTYEEVLRIPYPKAPVRVKLVLCDAEQRPLAEQTQRIDPADILIRDHTGKPALPHKYLVHSGDSKDCIDLAILAEGYKASEMDTFLKDAEAATEALFSYEPFKSHRQHFNVVAVFSTSEESGVAVPREKRWPRTAFSSHFDTFYSDRYLTTRQVKAINNALIGIPHEHLSILAAPQVVPARRRPRVRPQLRRTDGRVLPRGGPRGRQRTRHDRRALGAERHQPQGLLRQVVASDQEGHAPSHARQAPEEVPRRPLRRGRLSDQGHVPSQLQLPHAHQ